MTITLNGEERDLPAGTTITTLLGDRTRGRAVVIDGAVVPRATWPTYRLQPGQQIELIMAVQGG